MTLKNNAKITLAMIAVISVMFAVPSTLIPAFAAPLTIDDFENHDSNIWPLIASDSTPSSSNSQSGLGGVIGATRAAQFDFVSGSSIDGGLVSFNNPGELTLDVSANGAVSLKLTYDAGGVGLGGIDLTQAATDIGIAMDISGSPDVDITVTLTDTGISAGSLGLPSSGGSENLLFEYSSFSGTVDFTDIDKIEILFELDLDENQTIENIATSSDTEDPVISCPADITINEGDSIDPSNTGIATATDNSGTPTITSSDVVSDGQVTRTWIAEDGMGNTDSCDQTITILSLEEQVDDIIDDVDALNDPDLNNGNINSLNKKLENAIKNIENGDDAGACEKLQSFIDHLNAFVNADKLDQGQVDPLIDAAQSLIDDLC